MADGTKIEWTDATWNPITGCAVVSPGCTHCYAMRLAGSRLQHHPSRAGLTQETKAGPVWTGEVRLNEQWLTQPLEWKRPRKIFVCAHGDLFAEGVPDEWIDRVFAVMAAAPQHVFQVLTKRPARMQTYLAARQTGDPWAIAGDSIADLLELRDHPAILDPKDMPLPNVWLGVSAEDQRRADERIPDLLATPAALRFVSLEPLLGPIDFTRIACPHGCRPPDYCNRCTPDGGEATGTFDAAATGELDWVIVGGESGPGARPMHPDWARSLRDQCQAAGVAFHFKQWGAWQEVYDRDRDDPDWRRCDRVARETPTGRWLNLDGGHGFHGQRVIRTLPIGKASAGRTLDGRTWDEFPGAAP